VFDQFSTDPLTLSRRQYSHWRQCHRRNRTRSPGGLNRHPTEEDMADDTFLNLRNEGSQHSTLVAQIVNEISLVPTAESLFINEPDPGTIFEEFTTEDHAVG
jgi:hypothetical protein